MKRLLKPIQQRMWRSYTAGAAKLHELTYLFWETTLRCNLSCRHCGSNCAPNSALPGELTTDEVKAAFDTIAEDFDTKKITVAVTGGEPLLRPDVFEVASHFAKQGMRWGMVTNGLLITDRVIELMKASGMGSIAISLDGPRQQHEYLRGRGTYALTVAAVERVRDAAFLDILEVLTCPTVRVLADLDPFYDFLAGLGIDQWRILPLIPIGRVKQHPKLQLDGAQWRELLDWIRDKRSDKRAPLKVTLDEEGFLGEPYEREVRELPYFCFAGIHAASILADGDVGG